MTLLISASQKSDNNVAVHFIIDEASDSFCLLCHQP